MKKLVFISMALAFFIFSKSIYAATFISLADNTLVTNEIVLRALLKSAQKALIITGDVGDTFAISEDGVVVKTITLAATSEKWVFNHAASSYKVDWSAPGTDTAILYLGD